MRIALTAAVILLAGCGTDGSRASDDYCQELEQERSAFVDLAKAAKRDGSDYLTDALKLFTRLQDGAPERLRDEWDTVVFAWDALVDVLEESGIDPADFDPEQRPASITPEQFATVKGVAEELGSTRVRDAVQEITLQASQVCNVDLSLS